MAAAAAQSLTGSLSSFLPALISGALQSRIQTSLSFRDWSKEYQLSISLESGRRERIFVFYSRRLKSAHGGGFDETGVEWRDHDEGRSCDRHPRSKPRRI